MLTWIITHTNLSHRHIKSRVCRIILEIETVKEGRTDDLLEGLKG